MNRRAAVKKLKNLVISPKTEVDDFKAKFEDTFDTVFLPNNVERKEYTYGGVKCDVLVPELATVGKVLIYVHGGCFVGGSCASYRGFCASLANECSCRVVLPEFRLAPTHPFPASLDDVFAVFSAIHAELEISRQFGSESKIYIAADGSGASIACAVLQRLSKQSRKDIGSLILFSPFLDFSDDAEIISSKKLKDEIISGEKLHRAVDLYTYSSNYTNSLISPLKASKVDLEDFPPVFIQFGTDEVLRFQIMEFSHKLEEVGVKCTLDPWPGMMFMFQLADEFLPDSHVALGKIGKLLNYKKENVRPWEIEERNKVIRKNNIGES